MLPAARGRQEKIACAFIQKLEVKDFTMHLVRKGSIIKWSPAPKKLGSPEKGFENVFLRNLRMMHKC